MGTSLQGIWKVTALEMNGMAAPPAMIGSASITVDDDRFTTSAMGAEYGGHIEIDDGAEPHRFDLVFETGPLAGTRSLGIYQLDDDRWKICLTVTATTRPCAFVTKPGDGLALEELQRA